MGRVTAKVLRPIKQSWDDGLEQLFCEAHTICKLSMWEIRYKELHGTSAKETNEKQLLRLREQVNLLYDRATTVGITKDKDLQKIYLKDLP